MTANEFKIGIVLLFVVFSSSWTCLEAITPVGKILIDTDAGSDDAIAILMALDAVKVNDRLEIIGITCVDGNADLDHVLLNVLKTLKVADRLDIPIYSGASHPLLLTAKKDHFFGQDGFGDFHYPDPPSVQDFIQSKHAVNAMIDLVKAHPGDITLIALGPLTNIALAIRIYPSFLDELQQLIIMGGSTEGKGNTRPGIEFNFHTDPIANYVVFDSSKSKPAILVPYETAVKVRKTMVSRFALGQSNSSKVWLVNSAESRILNSERELWSSADTVAMSVALTSGSIVTKSGIYYSEAIYDGIKTAGMFIVDYTNITRNPANTNLIQSINRTVYEEMLSRFFSS